jgi:hypothetical protein
VARERTLESKREAAIVRIPRILCVPRARGKPSRPSSTPPQFRSYSLRRLRRRACSPLHFVALGCDEGDATTSIDDRAATVAQAFV